MADGIIIGLDEQELTLSKRLRIQNAENAILTILFGIIGAGIFAVLYAIPMPFIMVSLFKFGLFPALAIIAVIGGIRGPIAGFLSGYLGIILHDLLFFNTVVTLTLPAAAYGVLGLVVGIATYDLSKGRFLGKMSVLSVIGLIFTALLLVVIGLYIDNHSILIGLGFILLPLVTTGLPSVILITPILARLWHIASLKIQIPWLASKID